ncbi:MAG: Uma2 family endonuclease [Clostridia bacterium]|nr:Uma2 family endonuclease [Clostridia bacterium]
MSRPEPPAGQIILTYDDYLTLPDDNNRYEILEGVLYVTPSPTTRHQRVSRNLGFLLMQYVEENNLGEIFYAPYDVILSDISVTQPDLIFVSRARRHIITRDNVQGAPDLVVEILSPATRERDKLTKAQIYARYGVDYYWILDPSAKTLEEYRREGDAFHLVGRYQGAEMVRTTLFPEWELDLGRVFRIPD